MADHDTWRERKRRKAERPRTRLNGNTSNLITNRHHHSPSSYTNNSLSSSSSSSSSSFSSSTTPREIPGFYYDSEKGRYFKIMPNRSLGSNHPFSAESIKSKQKQPEPVPRKLMPVLRPLEYLQQRELLRSLIPTVQKSQAHPFLFKSLRRAGLLESSCSSRSTFSTAVLTHPTRNEIILGRSDGSISRNLFTCNFTSCLYMASRRFTAADSEITSLHLSPSSPDRIIFNSFGSSSAPGMLFVVRIDTDDDGSLQNLDHLHGDEELITTFSLPKSTFWASDVGVGQKAVLGAMGEAVYLSSYRHYDRYRTSSDVFAVRIDPGQPSVFYAGCRDGHIRLFDIRCPQNNNPARGSGVRMHHASAVTNIEILWGWGVVGCAMDGSLCVWDTRAPASSHSVQSKYAPPVLELSGHVNEYTRGLGFAVNKSRDMVAAAGNDNILRLWSLRATPSPSHSHIPTGDGPYRLPKNSDPIQKMPFHCVDVGAQTRAVEFSELEEGFSMETRWKGRRGEGLWVAGGIESEVEWWGIV